MVAEETIFQTSSIFFWKVSKRFLRVSKRFLRDTKYKWRTFLPIVLNLKIWTFSISFKKSIIQRYFFEIRILNSFFFWMFGKLLFFLRPLRKHVLEFWNFRASIVQLSKANSLYLVCRWNLSHFWLSTVCREWKKESLFWELSFEKECLISLQYYNSKCYRPFPKVIFDPKCKDFFWQWLQTQQPQFDTAWTLVNKESKSFWNDNKNALVNFPLP